MRAESVRPRFRRSSAAIRSSPECSRLNATFVRSTEADVEVIVVPRERSGQTGRGEQGIVEQDRDVRELLPHQDDEFSSGAATGHSLNVSATEL